MRLSAAAFALLACATPALADAPTWEAIRFESSNHNGSQPAGFPLDQEVSISAEGEVTVRHFSLFHSDRFAGWLTAEEAKALDAAVAALQGDRPAAELSERGYDFQLAITGAGRRKDLKTRGHLAKAQAETLLLTLTTQLLDIAERLVHPPKREADVYEGRVETSWSSVYLNLGSNRRYEVEPEDMAERLRALDGEKVQVRGRLERRSSYSWWSSGDGDILVTELLSPKPGALEGTVRVSGDELSLDLGEREVPIYGEAAELLEDFEGEAVSLEGFLVEGPRGPRAVVASGVRAVLTEEDGSLEVGDAVLLVDTVGSTYLRVQRPDGRTTIIRRSKLDWSPAAVSSVGAAGALRGLGD